MKCGEGKKQGKVKVCWRKVIRLNELAMSELWGKLSLLWYGKYRQVKYQESKHKVHL